MIPQVVNVKILSTNMCNCNNIPPKCSCNSPCRKKTVTGKFGVAYVIETPCGKCKPCGWEVEFTDTPSQIETNCQKMMKWVMCPPLDGCLAHSGGIKPKCPTFLNAPCSSKPVGCGKCYAAPCSRGAKEYLRSKKNCSCYKPQDYHCCCQCEFEPILDECSCSQDRKRSCGKKYRKHYGGCDMQHSKNLASLDATLEKLKLIRRLPLNRSMSGIPKEPDKDIDKIANQEHGSNTSIVTVWQNDENKENLGETKEDVNEEPDETALQNDTFKVPMDEVEKLKHRRKYGKGQLLALIKKQHKLEMEAIHPTQPPILGFPDNSSSMDNNVII